MRCYGLAVVLFFVSCSSALPEAPADSDASGDLGTVLAPAPDLALEGSRDLALPPADQTAPAGPEDCPVPPMTTLYPGGLPPNPYAPQPPAESCIRRRHDAIIVLGCPNQATGAPAVCQKRRVELAVALSQAGYGDRFIPSGAAVHNSYVEAETLRSLLIAKGVPAAQIYLENQANHTDENIYYSSQIMAAHGWRSALVVSDDPGHLILSAVCDSNCCVELGRLTVLSFALQLPGETAPSPRAVGHYALYPATAPASPVAAAECSHITAPLKLMCTNLMMRKACMGRIMLP